jgi:FtsP/CotA-like multicopper oxidase with cupredoxin domain
VEHEPKRFSRRDFVRTASSGASAALLGVSAAGGLLASYGRAAGVAPARVPGPDSRNPLRRLESVAPRGLRLRAAPATWDIGGGVQAPGWLLNGAAPSPLLRVRRGELFEVELDNGIPDPLILHWHGLTPPEQADGHPRFAVKMDGVFPYRFTVDNRAGTYWYHSHSHMRVAKHTQLGIAGMILVEDDEEAALGLPAGEREVPIVLQDRRLDQAGIPTYEPNTMEGFAGNEPFGNGVLRPYLEVDSALYRFRLLNGSNARIFRLERSDGRPLVLIGNDGGLLERPLTLQTLDLAPGERADLLVDLSHASVGERILLRSAPFEIGGRGMQSHTAQDHMAPMDLVELRVTRSVSEPARIPELLSRIQGPDPAAATRERTFRFAFDRDYYSRAMDRHHINGQTFEMERVDAKVPFGQTEIWTFVNDNAYPHPIHLHATHFRVLSRVGGRGEVMPWEQGLKDTVLLHPDETVRVAVRFGAHRGLFPLHCHNLEHEDSGMMLNVLVE